VVKVEPPGGEATRSVGPFYDDVPGADRSLFFWHYNQGKRSVVLDLDAPEGVAGLRRLADGADVVIDTRRRGYADERAVGYDDLSS
jgi:crotonobetainyl-CoA:carnitine CoA-transferase CaiB-like acyl-CoA transferase